MATVRPRLDLIGLGLLSPGLAAVLYGLAQASIHHGFGHLAVIIPLTAGLLALAAFIVRARRGGGGTHPVVDLRLFRVRSFTGAASLMFVAGLAMYGALLLIPLYYQQVRGASALTAGLAAAFGDTFWWATGCTVAGALPALLLSRPPRSPR